MKNENSKKHYNECLVNDKKVMYHACSSDTLEKSKEYYGNLYKYIGSGIIWYVDGVKNISEKLIHFFVRIEANWKN